jgi:hypothetical protein
MELDEKPSHTKFQSLENFGGEGCKAKDSNF